MPLPTVTVDAIRPLPVQATVQTPEQVQITAPEASIWPSYPPASQDLSQLTKAEKWKLESPLRYCNLGDEERKLVDAVLRGLQSLDKLPPLPKRVVRMFISSTFTDTLAERNALMDTIYPKLRTYCRERYGIEFQVVDMRWGIPDQAQDDHSVLELCLEEIQNCDKHSVGPTFVAFVGQKHGWHPLPTKIPTSIYELIREELVAQSGDVALLDQWYIKDSNIVPSVFQLQPISAVLGKDLHEWTSVSATLQSLLEAGAVACVEKSHVGREFLEDLRASVTELEIKEGMLKGKKQNFRDNNCLCVLREISNLKDHLDKYKIRRFVDLHPGSTDINNEALESSNNLRNKRLPEKLPKANIFTKSVEWVEPGGISEETHNEYIEELGLFFFRRVREMIDRNVAVQESMNTDELYLESLQHWNTVHTRCLTFSFRHQILEEAREYILGDTNHPLILYGAPGSGKTTLLAKVAAESPKWIRQTGRFIQTSVIVRFLGTTPQSSTITQLLCSLCHQLAYIAKRPRHQVPQDFKELKQYFIDLVQTGEFGGLVIIVLDALDQLSGEDGAHTLAWVPAHNSNNVKIILATLPDKFGIYRRLQQKVRNEAYHVEVPPMEVQQCSDIVSSLLEQNSRSIQFPQWKIVKAAFEKCSLPLFAKLTFEEACQWKSYTPVNEESLATSVVACINKMFSRLEEKFGSTLVTHALSYLTASRRGISETELEDVLSIDDTVLNSIFIYWEPPIRRIPPILWPRIRHEISHYLTEREEDEINVIFWYHWQFIEVVKERYLSIPEVFDNIHHNLSDYLSGIWSGTFQKPFTYGPELAYRLKLENPESKACRHVPKQPLVFNTFNTFPRFNLRKLNHLPYHLAMAKRFGELESDVYFNYEWLLTKLKACSVQQTISDFHYSDSKEVKLVADALRMCEAALAANPNLLGPEIIGRLLPHYSKHKLVRSLIEQCDVASVQHSPFVPNWQIFTTPGGPLQYVCETDASYKREVYIDVLSNEETVLLAAKPVASQVMRLWDVAQGEPRPDLKMHSGCLVQATPDGTRLVLIKNNRFLQVLHVDSGEITGQVDFGHGVIQKMTVSNKYASLTMEHMAGPVIIDLEEYSLVHKFQYQANLAVLSKDEKFVICNHMNSLIMHEFPLMTRKCVINKGGIPLKICFMNSPSKFYVLFQDSRVNFYQVDFVHHSFKITGMISDIEVRNISLGFTEIHFMIRASRCLFLFDTRTQKMSSRIQKMPPGVFVEPLSTFREAAFSKDDKLIVAARYVYIGIWATATGHPIRLLESAVSPISRLFTSNHVNKAVTLLHDNSIQVWDLDNLEADVRHLNPVVRGSVTGLAFSQTGKRFICHGIHRAEAKIGNIANNQCEHTLVHSDDPEDRLDGVLISPNGRFSVTRAPNRDEHEYLKHWDLLKEDKLWDLHTGNVLCTVKNSRFVVFGEECNKVVFLICRAHASNSIAQNCYDLFVVDGQEKQQCLAELPPGEIAGQPVMPGKGSHLVYIFQHPLDDSGSCIKMCAYSFTKQWKGAKLKKLNDLWSKASPEDNFVDVKAVNKDNILLTFGKNLASFAYKEDRSLDRSKCIAKGALIYNVTKDWLIKVIPYFMDPNSDISFLQVSSRATMVLDKNYKTFDIVKGEPLTRMEIGHIVHPGSVRLILDGRYVVGLSKNRKELAVIRVGDSHIMGKIFIHGFGTCVEVGHNDRTVAVGCEDGRVMILTVILDSPDPNREIISKLPGRKVKKDSTLSAQSILENIKADIINLRSTQDKCRSTISNGDILTNETYHPLDSDVGHLRDLHKDLQHLSTVTKVAKSVDEFKKPGFAKVGKGVLMMQQRNRVKSEHACSIQ